MSQEAVSRSSFHPKATFQNLSDAILGAAKALQSKVALVEMSDLTDMLHQCPRLPQWTPFEGGYRIFSINDAVSVTVTETKIYMTKGIRVHDIQDGLPAATLHKAIQLAQNLVSPAINAPVMSEEEQAAFFDADDVTGADIDSALAEPETVPNMAYGTDGTITERDDEELIEEVEGALTTDEVEPGQFAIDDTVLEEPQAKQYSGKLNKSSASDAYQVKEEYKDKDPVKSCPSIETTRVVTRLKAFQGRILNIMEASFADKEQRAAVKTLINKEFRREISKATNGYAWMDSEDLS